MKSSLDTANLLTAHRRGIALSPTNYPAVSMLLPIDGDSVDRVRLRLRQLVVDAVDRLGQELPRVDTALMADRLSESVDCLALSEGQQGLAIFVGDQTRIVPLSVRVRERVVIDDTYATRDLFRALQRSPRYRIAVLGRKRTRLYEGVGLTLSEVAGEDFRVDDPTRDRGRVTGADFVRGLDDALDPHLREDPLPLILVGIEPRLGAVANRSRHREAIVGTVRGAHDYPDPIELARLTWPTIEVMLHRETAAALDELDRSRGSRRYVSGVSEVWTLATQGRGELLLVEEGFEYPALVDAITGEAIASDDRDAPGVIDDLVDEIIEIVRAKRGRSHIVPDGQLAEHGRIAMKLRY